MRAWFNRKCSGRGFSWLVIVILGEERFLLPSQALSPIYSPQILLRPKMKKHITKKERQWIARLSQALYFYIWASNLSQLSNTQASSPPSSLGFLETSSNIQFSSPLPWAMGNIQMNLLSVQGFGARLRLTAELRGSSSKEFWFLGLHSVEVPQLARRGRNSYQQESHRLPRTSFPEVHGKNPQLCLYRNILLVLIGH